MMGDVRTLMAGWRDPGDGFTNRAPDVFKQLGRQRGSIKYTLLEHNVA